jgi:hypothetical protein
MKKKEQEDKNPTVPEGEEETALLFPKLGYTRV